MPRLRGLTVSAVERAAVDTTKAAVGIVDDDDLLRLALYRFCDHVLGDGLPLHAFDLPLKKVPGWRKIGR
jgi:hypothetical protein